MANFANSVLTNAILKVNKGFQEVENRTQEYGALQAFRSNPYELERIARLATERQKPYSFRMNTFSPKTGTNALTCNPTAAVGDSADTPLSWNTATGEIVISNKRQTENQYTTDEQAEIDLRDMWYGIYNQLETAALTYLNANRSQADISQGLSIWNGATDYYNSVAIANKDRLRSIIRSEMRKAKYNMKLNLIHTSPYDEFFLNTQIQGSGNARNYADQDMNFNYFYTNGDIELANTYGGMFVVPVNGIAMIVWIDPIYRQGQMSGDKEWGVLRDPLFGMDFGYFKKDDCADSSAIGGAAQDLVTSMQVHVNYAFAHAPVTSPANETPIHKYALATS